MFTAMRLLSIMGARPQFIKVASIDRALSNGMDHVVIHTGQHYDADLSGQLISELNFQSELLNLEVGSGSHGLQTGKMLIALEAELQKHAPDWVLVYGDTNSTLAGALAASKLNIALCHVESGLRSGNRAMPEEINRIVSDHVSDICFAPTLSAEANLEREGLAERTIFSGDVSVEATLWAKQRNEDKRPELPGEFSDEPYCVATFHRAELGLHPGKIAEIIDALEKFPVKVILPMHPRFRDEFSRTITSRNCRNLSLVRPLSYFQMIYALSKASVVVTDSGGLQKEAFILGIPTITVRRETEWLETLVDGRNVLVWDRPADIGNFRWGSEAGEPTSQPFGTQDAPKIILRTLARGPVSYG